jgi:hypothetical protein
MSRRKREPEFGIVNKDEVATKTRKARPETKWRRAAKKHYDAWVMFTSADEVSSVFDAFLAGARMGDAIRKEVENG